MGAIKIFLASLCAGVVLGAPVGVAGAMVADAAFAHSKKRLYTTVFVAALGDAMLAAFTTIFSAPFQAFLKSYEKIGLVVAGVTMLVVGAVIILVTYHTHMGFVPKEKIHNPPSKWIFAHFAPVFATFLTALFHPGNIAAFLFIMTTYSMLFPDFVLFRFSFISGIFLGSMSIFGLAGFLFWKIREKADKFVHYLRYALAAIIIFAGVYLVML